VESGIGATLREARKRRKIELSEVEAATKIRPAYLRAIEAEDWDALPGDAYTRGFVRTYAGFLGLDGARLAATIPARQPPLLPGAAPREPPRRALIGLVCVGLLAAIGVIGLLWHGGEGEVGPVAAPQGSAPAAGSGDAPSAAPSVPKASEGNGGALVLSLATTAELWVCLLDESGKPLVDGVVLPPGAEEGPFRSGSFTVSFGNGEVEMSIDGRDSEIPESASPLGYEIGHGGDLKPLSESERPTCL
jgi:transcriptional regulator with XRE-family HTH domain